MERARGRRAALIAALCAAAVIVAAIIAGRDLILEQWWIWRLGSRDEATWRAAAERLGEMRSVRAAPALVGLYVRESIAGRDGEAFTRHVLVRIGPKAIAALVKSVEDGKSLIDFVAEGSQGEGVEAFAGCAEDPDRTVRLRALRALLIALTAYFAIDVPDSLKGSMASVLEREKDIEIRFEAARILLRLDVESRSVRDVFREAILHHPDPQLRYEAIGCLLVMAHGTGLGLRTIEKALEDPSPDVRARAVEALRDERRSRPALVRALGDPDPQAAGTARRAIQEIVEGDDFSSAFDEPEAMAILDSIPGVLAGKGDVAWAFRLVQEIGPRAAPATAGLVAFVGEREALRALEAIGPGARKAVPALRKLLDDNFEMYWAGVRALQAIDPDRAFLVSALVRRLKEGDAQDRIRAAFHLRSLGTDAAAAAPSIIALVEREERDARPVAIEALGRIGKAASEALPLLIRILIDRGEDESTRRAAARAVSDLGGGKPEAAAALRTVLEEPGGNAFVREAAAAGLGRFGLAEDIPRLVKALGHDDFPVRGGAADGLGEMGPAAEAAREPLRAALSDEMFDVRFRAGRALWKVTGESAPVIPILASAVGGNEIEPLRVGEMPPRDPDAVVSALLVLCEDGPRGKREALKKIETILGKTRSPSVPDAIRRLSSDDVCIRFQAARTLGEIGPDPRRCASTAAGGTPREALPALEKLAADDGEDPDVRDEARWAIGRIGG
jgi:HEAT repeat protein